MSSDGSTIAFVASDSSGVSDIRLRSLGSGKTRMVPGADGANQTLSRGVIWVVKNWAKGLDETK